ncbi:MAG: hypothetical protein GXO76_07685 [Calditrichaeota bacterium]|nr:hypothetical protein [Calditrichota bacterium]
MEKTPEEKAVVRKIILGFAAALFAIMAVVTAGLLFMVHRTHSYLAELNRYPQNYVVFYQKDPFQIPKNGIISKSDFERFLALQKILETKMDSLVPPGETRQTFLESDPLKQLAQARQAEMSLFKKERYSIKAYKWIARQILLAFGGSPLHKFRSLAGRAPFGKTTENVEEAISKIPDQNLALFDQFAGQIASFRFLWLTAI